MKGLRWRIWVEGIGMMGGGSSWVGVEVEVEVETIEVNWG